MIYDEHGPDARLFLALPDDEKQLWHSHEYEVRSGVPVMPSSPGPVEHKDMVLLPAGGPR